jgi:hypothetical protein
MTDEELCKRLRDYEEFEHGRDGQIVCQKSEIAVEAADRIEALTAERGALKQIAADHVLQELEQAARADKAEAKLAKAVEALREALYFLRPTESDMEKKAGIYRIVTTLEEIEGDKP